jgi:3-oxoacyl-[acyl-carrier-protein] synthase II
MAVAAGLEAVRSSAIGREGRIGAVVGTAFGDIEEFENRWLELRESAPPTLNGNHRDWMRYGVVGDQVARHCATDGPLRVVSSACAAGNHAIAWSAEMLQRGEADAMIALGTDVISYGGMLGFNRLLLQAPELCQPFDKQRRGTILAEGAGALVLETARSALERGAPILAEVAGWGLSCDAGGAFASDLHDNRGMKIAVNRALARAEMAPEEIGHVSAHASGTRLNDRKETILLKEVMGDHARRIPINGIKSMLGHTQGAASTLEAIASVLTLTRDVVYPTANYRTPDPECDLDYVPNEARSQQVDSVMSNSFGIGGNNAIVIFRRWREA